MNGMTSPILDLGDTVELEGINTRVVEVRHTFGGIQYLLKWVMNGDVHEEPFFESYLVSVGAIATRTTRKPK